MASNKFLVPDSSKMLQAKLDRMSAKLQGAAASQTFQTQEEYLVESIKLLQDFYKTLNSPQLQDPAMTPDQLPSAELYNKLWNQILDDLTIVFTELENVEGLTVGNFNFITTETNRLTTRLKAVSSKLGDYMLYSLNTTKDALFFKDSFNDLSKLEINSPLLNGYQCEVFQEEGVVTLPLDLEKDSQVSMTQLPVINPDSNGVAGNNQQLGAKWNGDLQVLLDNNPDTWFEYERVTTAAADTKDPLILDVTLNLGAETVINHIRVNPNNFGTKTVIQIEAIETSVDGKVYINIKDDIPIAGFVTDDEENIFALAPSTSKFAGQGLYTFTPRNVKYIHCVFKQSEPYIISTPAGERLRYAIGIRDIDIRALHFRNLGELITTRYQALDEIRKVMLDTNQNPTVPSELASIQYFLSGDDGATWNEIQPKRMTGTAGLQSTVPEVIDFNGISPDSVVTSVPIQSLRMKMILKRNDEAFDEGTSSLRTTVATQSELHEIPTHTPLVMNLEKAPVDGTVVVIDPLYGSRGIPSCPYILGHTHDRLNMRTYNLPLTNLPWPLKKIGYSGTDAGDMPAKKYHTERVMASEWIHLAVGGEEWVHAVSGLDSYSSTSKVYLLDPFQGTIVFGNDTHGQAPAENEPVTLWFAAERIYPSTDENAHLAKLDFPTSANKQGIKIKRYDLIQQVTETLPKAASVIRLQQQHIIDTAQIGVILGNLGYTEVPYLNGRDELVELDANYSLDTEGGVLYFGLPTPTNEDIVISYSYQPIYELTDADWDWGMTTMLRDSVVIKDTAWKTIEVKEERMMFDELQTVIDLGNMAIVKGTLVIAEPRDRSSGNNNEITEEENPFLKEVDFQDGRAELGSAAIKVVEQIPYPLEGIALFNLNENILTNTSYPVIFSNTNVFANEVLDGESLNDPGDYLVDRALRRVRVVCSGAVMDPGTITYYKSSTNFIDNGLYSVDYRNGKIYTQRPVRYYWSCSADYSYIDIRAEYRVARYLSLDSYEVDITNRTVTIKDDEVLTNYMVPQVGMTAAQARYYLINYDSVESTREQVKDLKELFTPVIKDYALKILTKSKVL